MTARTACTVRFQIRKYIYDPNMKELDVPFYAANQNLSAVAKIYKLAPPK